MIWRAFFCRWSDICLSRSANCFYSTGATGYIGGDVLHLLRTTHPEYECRVLMRDTAKATTLTQAYLDVRIVSGVLALRLSRRLARRI